LVSNQDEFQSSLALPPLLVAESFRH